MQVSLMEICIRAMQVSLMDKPAPKALIPTPVQVSLMEIYNNQVSLMEISGVPGARMLSLPTHTNAGVTDGDLQRADQRPPRDARRCGRGPDP